MAKTNMRENLKPLEEFRGTFRGVFKRFGQQLGKGKDKKTMLLRNITDKHNKTLCDHCWLKVGKRIEKLGDLKEGDKIEFDGRVKKYRKGSIKRGIPVSWDYKFHYHSNIHILSKTNICAKQKNDNKNVNNKKKPSLSTESSNKSKDNKPNVNQSKIFELQNKIIQQKTQIIKLNNEILKIESFLNDGINEYQTQLFNDTYNELLKLHPNVLNVYSLSHINTMIQSNITPICQTETIKSTGNLVILKQKQKQINLYINELETKLNCIQNEIHTDTETLNLKLCVDNADDNKTDTNKASNGDNAKETVNVSKKKVKLTKKELIEMNNKNINADDMKEMKEICVELNIEKGINLGTRLYHFKSFLDRYKYVKELFIKYDNESFKEHINKQKQNYCRDIKYALYVKGVVSPLTTLQQNICKRFNELKAIYIDKNHNYKENRSINDKQDDQLRIKIKNKNNVSDLNYEINISSSDTKQDVNVYVKHKRNESRFRTTDDKYRSDYNNRSYHSHRYSDDKRYNDYHRNSHRHHGHHLHRRHHRHHRSYHRRSRYRSISRSWSRSRSPLSRSRSRSRSRSYSRSRKSGRHHRR